jgi:hypothetical protein
VSSDGHWTADQNSELLPNQFVKASVLSDSQQRRTRIMTELLQAQPNKRVPAVPTIYGWTPAWETGFVYGQNAPVTGTALVEVPLNWTAAEADKECTLPGPLLSFQEVTGPDGYRPSGFYDFRINEWTERSGETASWIAFNLPPEIMPVTMKRAEITIKVKGAMGRLKISGFKDGKVQEIHTWENPVGTLTYTIEDGSVIPLDANGRFIFRLDAGTSNAEAFSSGSGSTGDATASPDATGTAEAAPITTNNSNITNYWEFEGISARITVVTPPSDNAPAASP